MILSIGKNILICPLEWGLGHAGRMIPVAIKLKELGNKVFIGSGEEVQSMFRQETEGLSYISFPGFKPRYSGILPQYLIMLLKIPSLIISSYSEHRKLNEVISQLNINIIISDNRFGLWNKRITSVYITHMPRIPFPDGTRFLEWIGIRLHRWVIRKYSFCLIPDLPGSLNLSGRLSHGIRLPGNTRYIGILSRFAGREYSESNDKYQSPRTTLILSGPEPQKSIFRNRTIGLLRDTGTTTVILEGKPGKEAGDKVDGNLISFSHLPSDEMRKVITGSELIISRPGYTTLMELLSIRQSALVIPTPGQTEQEYLAHYLSAKGWFKTIRQKDLKAGISISSGNPCEETSELLKESELLLDEALEEILQHPDNQDHSK